MKLETQAYFRLVEEIKEKWFDLTKVQNKVNFDIKFMSRSIMFEQLTVIIMNKGIITIQRLAFDKSNMQEPIYQKQGVEFSLHNLFCVN